MSEKVNIDNLIWYPFNGFFIFDKNVSGGVLLLSYSSIFDYNSTGWFYFAAKGVFDNDFLKGIIDIQNKESVF